MARSSKILIGLTSHDDLGGVRRTGYFLSEVAHPWRVFVDAGCTVDLVSVAGGEPPVDGVDLSDPIQKAFMDDAEIQRKARETPTFADVDHRDYDAIVFAGGHGTLWDFPNNAAAAALARDVYEAGGVLSAICHGPAALIGLTLSDGTPLVAGRRITSFTNDEEAAAGLADAVPFFLQTELEQLGAEHEATDVFQPYVVTDGRLVTGQNPPSSTPFAEAVLAAMAG